LAARAKLPRMCPPASIAVISRSFTECPLQGVAIAAATFMRHSPVLRHCFAWVGAAQRS
jgi:hypothetical protein